MDSPAVIVVHIGVKDTAKLPIVEHDHMIQGVSVDAADYSLAIRILPGTARCSLHFFNAQILDPLLKRFDHHMSRMSSRTSLEMSGRPGLSRWLSCRQ